MTDLLHREVVVAESVNNEVVKESEDRPSGSLFGLGKVVDKLDDLVHRLRSVEQTHLMELELQGGFLVGVVFLIHGSNILAGRSEVKGSPEIVTIRFITHTPRCRCSDCIRGW